MTEEQLGLHHTAASLVGGANYWPAAASRWRMTRSVSSSRRQRALSSLGAIGLALALAFATAATWLPLLGGWLAVMPDPQHSDAIVVLGGGPQRADQAIALYVRGVGGELWITGEESAPTGSSTFARRMAERVVAGGVPSEAVHLLSTTSTWEDGSGLPASARFLASWW